jgi:hypothetical protein
MSFNPYILQSPVVSTNWVSEKITIPPRQHVLAHVFLTYVHHNLSSFAITATEIGFTISCYIAEYVQDGKPGNVSAPCVLEGYNITEITYAVAVNNNSSAAACLMIQSLP